MYMSSTAHAVVPKKTVKKTKKSRRDQHFVARDLLMAISLCHNVTPVYPNERDRTVKELQASSPDEVALVKFGDILGM